VPHEMQMCKMRNNVVADCIYIDLVSARWFAAMWLRMVLETYEVFGEREMALLFFMFIYFLSGYPIRTVSLVSVGKSF
jgi:hypothetical protein